MKNKIIYAIMLCIALTACNHKPEETKEEAVEELPAGEVELSADQFEKVGIELGTIEQRNLKSVVKASGYLDVPPQSKADVSTFIGAMVKSILVLEGSFVKKGQALAILEHPDFIKLQQEYISEKSNYAYLEKEYQRQKELSEQNAGTGKVFQKAETDYITSKAKLNALEEELKMLSVNISSLEKGNLSSVMTLVAPIDGYIGHIRINIGTYAEPNKTLFEIVDNTKIHCDLLVYEKDLFKVKVGQKVNFILTNLPEHQDEHDSRNISGEIFSINKSFENDTKALTVHAKIENEKHELIPGMYVNALIDIGEQTTPSVPFEAIVKSAGKEYIYVTVNGSDKDEKKTGEPKEASYTFKMIEVITGVSDLGYTEITTLEPLPAGAKVVVKNAFFILSKAKSGEGEEE